MLNHMFAFEFLPLLVLLVAAFVAFHQFTLRTAHLGCRGGVAIELLCGSATAPSTTATALTMNVGNSLQVRNCPFEKKVMLLQAWADVQGAGTLRIRSPKLHDNVQGMRFDTVVSDCMPLMPWGGAQRLIPQDVLTVDLTGSATAGDIESAALLIYYEDQPGTNARLISADELMKKGVNTLSVENTLATGTAGGFSGEEAINAEFDLLKANTDYALIGYLVDTECLAVRWRGADTGNLGLGGPGIETERHITSNWFQRLSKEYGMPLIPVFNSANKAGILIDAHQDENGADVTVTSLLIEIGPSR